MIGKDVAVTLSADVMGNSGTADIRICNGNGPSTVTMGTVAEGSLVVVVFFLNRYAGAVFLGRLVVVVELVVVVVVVVVLVVVKEVVVVVLVVGMISGDSDGTEGSS